MVIGVFSDVIGLNFIRKLLQGQMRVSEFSLYLKITKTNKFHVKIFVSRFSSKRTESLLSSDQNDKNSCEEGLS